MVISYGELLWLGTSPRPGGIKRSGQLGQDSSLTTLWVGGWVTNFFDFVASSRAMGWNSSKFFYTVILLNFQGINYQCKLSLHIPVFDHTELGPRV